MIINGNYQMWQSGFEDIKTRGVMMGLSCIAIICHLCHLYSTYVQGGGLRREGARFGLSDLSGW